MSFLNAILVAVVMFAVLAGLSLLFGVFEYTTDHEFKTRRFFRDSYRRIPLGERNLLLAFAAVMALIYLSSTQLTDVNWLNWLLLAVAMGIEVFYLVWTLRISDRIRELVVGCVLLVATWPVFGSLCANLCAPGNIDSGPLGWVRAFVVACAIALLIVVCCRICPKINPDKPRFELSDYIPKEEPSHEG